jgi:hypothetical protein
VQAALLTALEPPGGTISALLASASYDTFDHTEESITVRSVHAGLQPMRQIELGLGWPSRGPIPAIAPGPHWSVWQACAHDDTSRRLLAFEGWPGPAALGHLLAADSAAPFRPLPQPIAQPEGSCYRLMVANGVAVRGDAGSLGAVGGDGPAVFQGLRGVAVLDGLDSANAPTLQVEAALHEFLGAATQSMEAVVAALSVLGTLSPSICVIVRCSEGWVAATVGPSFVLAIQSATGDEAAQTLATPGVAESVLLWRHEFPHSITVEQRLIDRQGLRKGVTELLGIRKLGQRARRLLSFELI